MSSAFIISGLVLGHGLSITGLILLARANRKLQRALSSLEQQRTNHLSTIFTLQQQLHQKAKP